MPQRRRPRVQRKSPSTPPRAVPERVPVGRWRIPPQPGMPARPIRGDVRHTTIGYRATRKPPGPVAAGKKPRGLHPPKDKNVSKRQQRFFFAVRAPWAHATARRGADYKRLPERTRRGTVRSAR